MTARISAEFHGCIYRRLVFVFLITVLFAGGCAKQDGTKVTEDKKETDYTQAKQFYDNQEYEQAHDLFVSLGDYNDALELANDSYYLLAYDLMLQGDYENAEKYFTEIGDYKESANYIMQCKYLSIQKLIAGQKYAEARQKIIEIADAFDTSDLTKQCDYYEGVDYYNNKKYAKAARLLLSTIDYQESNDYLIKSAKKLIKKNNLGLPQKICKQLSGVKGISKVEKQLMLAQKYSMYKANAPIDYVEANVTCTPEQAEEILKEKFYGGWVEYFTGEKFQMDKYKRNGRAYGVYSLKHDEFDWWYYLLYYYMDAPEKIYVEMLHRVSVPGGQSQLFLESTTDRDYLDGDYCYAKMTEDEMYAYAAEVQKDDTPLGDNTQADNNSGNSSGNNGSSGGSGSSGSGIANEQELIAAAMSMIPAALAQNNLGGASYEVLDCLGVTEWLAGYKVTFRINITTNYTSTKNLSVMFNKSPLGGYKFTNGMI